MVVGYIIMMLTNHILVSLVLALPFIVAFPEFAVPITVSLIVGGSAPDLDILFGTHRKTLHIIPLYLIGMLMSFLTYLVIPSINILYLLLVFGGAFVHTVTDIFGSGLEKEPWKQTSDKGVYNHIHKKWIKPRHIFSYDGSPRDLLTGVFLASIIYMSNPPIPQLNNILFILLSIGGIYTLVRKRLPRIETLLKNKYPILNKIL